MVDGYRVTYTYPKTYSFANLRAERSDPSKYNADKRLVTENFEEFISLRDRFVRGYIECVAKKRAASTSSQKR